MNAIIAAALYACWLAACVWIGWTQKTRTLVTVVVAFSLAFAGVWLWVAQSAGSTGPGMTGGIAGGMIIILAGLLFVLPVPLMAISFAISKFLKRV